MRADLAEVESVALAHASSDGHVCGKEEAMRVFAAAICDETRAEHVFVTPTETLVKFDGEEALTRFVNGDGLREALDRFLLTGELPEEGFEVELLPPS